MRGKWRLFRQEAGRVSGPHPLVYVLLFVLCIGLGQWSIERYGAVYIWPANGVLLAACLQLHRRRAIAVLATCFLINIAGNCLRGSQPDLVIVNAALNLGEAVLAGVLARRFCGAALDMRRPARLLRFALIAAAPSVLISALIGIPAARTPPAEFLPTLQTWFTIETLGLLTITPTLLLIARSHRFAADHSAPAWEKAALMALLVAVTVGVFAQNAAPVSFLVFLPLLLIAFRLSPTWSAFAILAVAVISGGFTLNQLGPLMLSTLGPSSWRGGETLPILRALPVLHIFIMAVVGVSLSCSTILTERQRLQAKLKARTEAAVRARIAAEQAAAAKARFLSVMSHELRTPLNGVAGYAELLSRRACLDSEAERQVAQIRRSGDNLLTLVDDILTFANDDGALAEEPFRPAVVIEGVVERSRADAALKGLSITVTGADLRACYLGDARRLRQVLRHLLSNAVKFTETGGVEIAARLEPDRIVVEVADTGPGVDEAALPALFEQFAQADISTSRRHDGIGMGLALARRDVEAMGGTLTGRRREEGGSLFEFCLPMPRQPDAHGAASDPGAEGRPPRVLVVDDHPVNREVAGLMLDAAGCEVEMACDGAEAVEAAAAGRFDLILMDVRMPQMDGLEATRRIRALAGQAAAVPIVAFTADAMPDDVARCLAAGMQAHIAKPVSQARLHAVLCEQLGADETAPQDRSVA
jgi:signal transduction histidine kinase/ActR/RegA family two-component response regulator